MEAGERGSSRRQIEYKQLAVTSVGNALSLALLLLLYQVWSILSDYQDALLYALLCSIALRELKTWLVECIDSSLARERSVTWALLSVVALPLMAVVDVYREGRSLAVKWRRYVLHYQEEWQRRNQGSSSMKKATAPTDVGAEALEPAGPAAGSAAGLPLPTARAGEAAQLGPVPAGTPGLALPASPSTPRSRLAPILAGTDAAAQPGTTQQPQSMPTLALYAQAGLRVLKSRRTSRKRRKQRQAARAKPVVASSVLFRWLLRAMVAWLVYEWVREAWSTTVQLLLLVTTAVLALGSLPLLYLATNKYLGSNFSPIKTPKASTAPRSTTDFFRRSNGTGSSTPRLTVVTPPRRPRFSPVQPGAKVPAAAAEAEGEQLHTLWRVAAGWLHSAAQLLAAGWAALERHLRAALRANLHALVSALLILGLLLGSTGLAAFLTVRVVQEGRATVLAVRDVFPTAWAGMAASMPLLADAVSDDGSATPDGGTVLAAVPPWVRAYQQDALSLVQRALPEVATWVERRLQQFVASNNLTSALGDMRLLYETLQGPRRCSEKEHEKLLISMAKADLAVHSAAASKQQANSQLAATRAELASAVAALSAKRAASTPAYNCSAEHRGACLLGSREEGSELAALEQQVVEADAAVGAAKDAQKTALQLAEEAEKQLRSAESRLSLCLTGSEQEQGHHSALPPVLREAGEQLQHAYAKIWRRQFKEGLADMRAAAWACASALRNITTQRLSGSEAVAADLGTLQRLAQAAADPLFAATRIFAGSVGSTTAAALMGGLGLLRLGVGVVKFGMQLTLFLALLYYLLAAQGDPLVLAVGVLPLSESGRQRAAVALSRALGGVFLSSMKLVAFHGGFTWLTFRVFSIPLCYTASVASAIAALLPFIPTYVVALPGCVLLALQGQALAALLFGLLHFLGYYLGDTIILEDIPGGHPYMLSLGILGGIYTFDNPLQGCLMGPILLSLLSVFYVLHSEFMGTSGISAQQPGGGPAHRLWSATPTHLGSQSDTMLAGMGPGAGGGQVPALRVQLASPQAPSVDAASQGSPLTDAHAESISLGGQLSHARRGRDSPAVDEEEQEEEDLAADAVSNAVNSAGSARGSFSFLAGLNKAELSEHEHAD